MKLTQEQIEQATRAIADIDAVLSRRNVQPQAREFCESCDHGVVAGAVCADCGGTGYESEAPAPVDAGLVERMIGAYLTAKESAVDGRRAWMNESMTAALRVAADDLLGPVTDEENECLDFTSYNRNLTNRLFAARRARLLAPAKSAEEQIKEKVHALCQLPTGSKEQNEAANEVLSLIAALKQESK